MWGLELNGVAQLNKAMTASASNELDRQNNTFRVECGDIDETFHFLEANLSIDSEDIASGIVINQTFMDVGYKQTSIECTDHYYILQHRKVTGKYVNETVSNIMIDLIAKFAPEFSSAAIDATAKILESFDCNYILFSEAITKLMKYLPDHHYYIDANRTFHLFEDYETDGIRFEPDINGKNKFLDQTLTVEYEAVNVANRVWVIGAKQASPETITQYFTGDGKQRYFKLAYEPNYAVLYVDDILKTSKLETNDDGLQDFLINKSGQVFFIPANIVTPFTGEIKMTYRPTIQVIDVFDNQDSDNPYLLEKVIKNKDITDKLQARAIGKAEIRKRKSIRTFVSFQTYETVKIGQRCYVKNDEYNLDGYFLVKKADMTFMTGGLIIFAAILEGIG